nr:hypothetical protein [Tanacetum cinerariifolium]
MLRYRLQGRRREHIKTEILGNVHRPIVRGTGTQKEAARTDSQTHEQTKLTQVAHEAIKVRQLIFKLKKKLHKKEKVIEEIKTI